MLDTHFGGVAKSDFSIWRALKAKRRKQFEGRA